MAEEKRFSAEVYYKCNSVDWITLIHGFGGSARTWKKQIDFFSKYYNLLVLEMHNSDNNDTNIDIDNISEKLDLDKICDLINNTLNYHEIKRSHFLSFSFSSLICFRFAILYPEKVKSLIMGGGIIKFNFRTRFLLFLAITFKKIIPYMILYKFFAYIILPRRNHAKSRSIFVNEAKKLGFNEFCKWIDIIPQTTNSLTWLGELNDDIKVLYVLGSEDHLFLKDTLKYSPKISNSKVEIIDNCGHICSIEHYNKFNNIIFEYLNSTHL